MLAGRPGAVGGQEADSSDHEHSLSEMLNGSRPVVPPGYFMFPIAPGKPNFLAGSMGELRPNHFHGGLDIKTGGGVNQPVYAAADGYISRLKQSSFGYGNVLYITHPNGLTTVYGHLNEFRGPVAAELLRRQYEKQSYELEMFLPKDQYPVKRGELVALSGNTGVARRARTCTGRCATPRTGSTTPCNGAASPRFRTMWRPPCRRLRWSRWALRRG